MAKGGYARLVNSLATFKAPPATSLHRDQRFITLCRFIARETFPEKGSVSRQHYANKDYARVLELKLPEDEELNVHHLATFVDKTEKVDRLTQLQLRIMVLETKIYLQTRVCFLAAVRQKFKDPVQKANYRQWVNQGQPSPARDRETDASCMTGTVDERGRCRCRCGRKRLVAA